MYELGVTDGRSAKTIEVELNTLRDLDFEPIRAYITEVCANAELENILNINKINMCAMKDSNGFDFERRMYVKENGGFVQE